MTSESPERRDREVATSTFEDWVAQKAEERDSSRGRVLEQLLDSYWTLEQISQVLGGRGASPPLPDEHSPNATNHPDEEHTNRPVTESDYTELLDDVEALYAELETESHRRTELADEVQSLAASLDDVEATRERADELSETVEELQASLQAEQARLDGRMDDEFDNLQTILEHLVQTDDNLGARISQAQVQFRAEIRELRAERDQLRRINEDARDLGTYTADCEQCGESIDLVLLTSPDCPNCDRTLTGVEAETNWLVLTSYTATTSTRATVPSSPDKREESDESTQAAAESDTGATTDETEPDTGATTDKTEPAQSTPNDSESRPRGNERQTDDREPGAESEQRVEQSSGTSPDETEFQWFT